MTAEIRRPKKPIAERDLGIQAMSNIAAEIVSVPVGRAVEEFATTRGAAKRSNCTLLKVARLARPYRSCKTVMDAMPLAHKSEVSEQHSRYGDRRVAPFVACDGHGMSPGRTHRLCRHAWLQLPKKRSRKRVSPEGLGQRRPTGPVRLGGRTSSTIGTHS